MSHNWTILKATSVGTWNKITLTIRSSLGKIKSKFLRQYLNKMYGTVDNFYCVWRKCPRNKNRPINLQIICSHV